MNAPTPESSYLRLDRAKEHIDFIHNEVGAFLDGHPYELAEHETRNPNPGPAGGMVGHSVYSLKVHREPPPSWGTIVGEALHDIRSALDHLAWQLGRLVNDPPPNRTAFPIFDSCAKYMAETEQGRPKRGSGLEQVSGLAPQDQAAIERLQPYNRPKTLVPDPLLELYRLSNFDKHRAVHPAFIVTGSPRIDIQGSRGIAYSPDFNLGLAAGDGAHIGRATWTLPRADAHMHVKIEAPILIALDHSKAIEQAKALGERPIVTALAVALHDMRDCALRIVEQFTGRFS